MPSSSSPSSSSSSLSYIPIGPPPPAPLPRVLSIQSHVISGYVGNKASVLPLQLLQYEVDIINTVSFSNHSGYGSFGGTRASAEELRGVFEAMEVNELLGPEVGRVLTGYVPGEEGLKEVRRLVERLKEGDRDREEGLIYLLDPVLGDAGKLYVSPSTIPIYRSMLPLATIITPNYFELQVLTGLAPTTSTSSPQPSSTLSLTPSTPPLSLKDLKKALEILHDEYQVPNVVVSSIPMVFFKEEKKSLPGWGDCGEEGEWEAEETLLCLSSSRILPTDRTGEKERKRSIVHLGHVPLIHGYYSGVGDLFSALVMAHFHPSPTSTSSSDSTSSEEKEESTPLSRATSLALSKTHAILQLTADSLPAAYRVPSSTPHTQSQPSHIQPPSHTPFDTHSEAVEPTPPSPNLTDDELDSPTLNPLRKTRRMRARELALVRGQGILRVTEEEVEEFKSKVNVKEGLEEGNEKREEEKRPFGLVIREMKLWEGFWDTE